MAEPIIRRDVRHLSNDQLNNLREAFQAVQQDTGPAGFQALAQLHITSCQHQFPLFLAWHREYIFRLETALRQLRPDLPDLSLPFWDWTDDLTLQQGIPEAFRDRQYLRNTPQADGSVLSQLTDNPLHHALLPNSQPTRRSGRSPVSLRALRTQVEAALRPEVASFEEFTKLILMPHNTVHAWTGGAMQGLQAAYDPLFWAHHASVDRYWAHWQRQHPGTTLTAEQLAMPLPGFPGKTVADVMDHLTELHYDYDYGSLAAPVSPVVFELLAPISPRLRRVQLHARDLRTDCGSFLIHIFVNQPDANRKTQMADNPHYAGAFGIFGCDNNEQEPTGHNHNHNHNNELEPTGHHHNHHPSHSTTPVSQGITLGDQVLDISETAALVAPAEAPIHITLLAETADEVPVELSEVPIGEVKIKIT